MRPVDKGASPATYTRYQDAAADLQSRIGDYCSYCERQIETHLAVEHIQPKSSVAQLRNAWSNFLLACVNCNSSKGDTPIQLNDYLWPDTDNTLLAFRYADGGLVEPNPLSAVHVRTKARATIELLGLDKDPGHPIPERRSSGTDRRWRRRNELWRMAVRDRDLLTRNDTPGMRELIIENAQARGMFSIWWTVFEHDADMRRRLRLAFPGTATDCFDAQECACIRPGGQA